jgi:hypothetical protein
VNLFQLLHFIGRRSHDNTSGMAQQYWYTSDYHTDQFSDPLYPDDYPLQPQYFNEGYYPLMTQPDLSYEPSFDNTVMPMPVQVCDERTECSTCGSYSDHATNTIQAIPDGEIRFEDWLLFPDDEDPASTSGQRPMSSSVSDPATPVGDVMESTPSVCSPDTNDTATSTFSPPPEPDFYTMNYGRRFSNDLRPINKLNQPVNEQSFMTNMHTQLGISASYLPAWGKPESQLATFPPQPFNHPYDIRDIESYTSATAMPTISPFHQHTTPNDAMRTMAFSSNYDPGQTLPSGMPVKSNQAPAALQFMPLEHEDSVQANFIPTTVRNSLVQRWHWN